MKSPGCRGFCLRFFYDPRPYDLVEGRDLFNGGLRERAVDLDDRIGVFSLALVYHVRYVKFFVGYDRRELGNYTGLVLMQHAEAVVAAERQRGVREVYAVLDIV